MSQNPFAQVPAPTQADPRTISISQFSRLNTEQISRLNATLRTFKKSLIYMAGFAALTYLTYSTADYAARKDLFGEDYRGGKYLELTTTKDENHYAYSREFQRVQLLGEAKIGDLSRHSLQLLRDKGASVPEARNPHIAKKAPHEKFY